MIAAHLSRSCLSAARLPQALLACAGPLALKCRPALAPGTLAVLPSRRTLWGEARAAARTTCATLRT